MPRPPLRWTGARAARTLPSYQSRYTAVTPPQLRWTGARVARMLGQQSFASAEAGTLCCSGLCRTLQLEGNAGQSFASAEAESFASAGPALPSSCSVVTRCWASINAHLRVPEKCRCAFVSAQAGTGPVLHNKVAASRPPRESGYAYIADLWISISATPVRLNETPQFLP